MSLSSAVFRHLPSLLLVLVSGLTLPAQDESEAWRNVEVPDVWKRPPGEISREGKGYAWYRCRVAIPPSWRGRKLSLFAEAADDARQFYVGAQKVGQMGEFPPRFRTGLGTDQRFEVPAATTDADQLVVAIRMYQEEARTNFNVAPPVLFGPDEALRLAGPWEVHFGDLPVETATSAASPVFDQRISAAEAEASLKRLQGDDGPLPVAETVRRMKVADDLELDVPLAEPDIGQPLQVKFDERGRMWVVQYLQYPTPAGLKMVSRDKYLRTVYDKTPLPPPHHFRGADKITIHEDTDGDGKFDKHKTFIEGLSLATSLAIGRGGVFVLNPPYLLFYADRNQDDVPDGDPEVLLEGFGLEDSHSICNSLRWGPDGWLYAAQGSTVTGAVRRYGTQDKPVHSMGQLIWRYHPGQRRYEIFAEGGGNTFGVEIDSQGRIFSGHNGGNTRGFHYVQGSYSLKGFGKHGELSNPYAYGYFPYMPHHDVPRFTHSFVIYESGVLPPRYDGALLGVAPLHSHVVHSVVEPNGSSFKTRDVGHAFQSDDPWCRPVEIRVGTDGAVYVADMYEQRIDHASHYQGRVHRLSGRIYRLRGKGSEVPRLPDLSGLNTMQLIEQLRHPVKPRRQLALRMLGDRRDPEAVEPLREMLRNESGQAALEALWALNLSGGLDEAVGAELLEHADPQVRLWTARLMCDDRVVSAEIAQRLASLATREPNVYVRSQLACSARRLPPAQAQPIVRHLLAHDEDVDDVHLPLLLWWAMETQVGQDRESVIELMRDEDLWQRPLVRQHLLGRLMRRLAAAGSRKDLLACAELLQLAPDDDAVQRLMKGLEEAFEGRPAANLPEPLLRAMARRGKASLPLRLRQQDDQALQEALQLIADPQAGRERRLQLISVLAQVGRPQSVAPLLELARKAPDQQVQAAAWNALQAFDDPQIGAAAVELHDQLADDVRSVAQSLLASRLSWTRQYVEAVKQGRIPAAHVPLHVVRRLLLHQDPHVGAAVAQLWGSVDGATTEQMLRRIEQYKQWIAEGSGNPYDGKRLFADNCGKCHVLFNQGGRIGPDLTAYKRDDLHAMLINVVNPSIEIREGFENYMIQTDDGRRLNGFVQDQDSRVVVLKKPDGQLAVIPRESIEGMKAVPVSIMPQGVLEELTEQDVRDLFAYLRATQPLP